MFDFIHITDLHILPAGETNYGLDPAERLRMAVESIAERHGPNSMAPAEFVIATGDLTHHGQPEAYAQLRDIPEGLPLWLARRHILPLAAPVAVSLTGVMLAGLLGGTLTMELLFGLPGMGALVLNGIQGRDQPVVLAGLVAAALAIVLVNAVTALVQSALDPRQTSQN